LDYEHESDLLSSVHDDGIKRISIEEFRTLTDDYITSDEEAEKQIYSLYILSLVAYNSINE
jgi:hypothetical protein